MTDSNCASMSRPKADMRLAIACFLAIMMRSYQPWLLDNGIIPTVGTVFSPAYKIQMAIRVLIELCIVLAAMRAPRLLRPRLLLGCSVACCVAGVVMLGIVPVSSLSMTIGLTARLIGYFFGVYVIGAALSRIDNARMVAVGVSCAVLAASCLSRFVPAPDLGTSVVLDAMLTLGSLALTWKDAEPVLSRIASSPEGSSWALVNPESFLLPNHQVFLLILFFSVAMGFGMFLRIEDLTPRGNSLGTVILAGVLLWFVLVPNTYGHVHEDALFKACALLVVAGFLLAPLEEPGVRMANALLFVGKLAFGVLSWTVLAALCARNPLGSIMFLACGELANATGILVGAELGDLCNAVSAVQPRAIAYMAGAIVLAFFAYVLIGLRGFSFARTIRGIEPVASLPSDAPIPLSRDALLENACEELSLRDGLTNREREVLGMLARGHNGYHIRDELGLSYNTVKTHVQRIYRKLDVHSQQELIDLVEGQALGKGDGRRQAVPAHDDPPVLTGA